MNSVHFKLESKVYIMEDKRIQLLKDGKISKAVIHMSIPAIIGLMVMGIYNFVDSMFVAWLGTAATGATQVVLPIMMLVSSFGLAFGIGGGSYISRLLGKNDKEEANRVGTVALFTAIIVGIAFTLLSLVFFEPILTFFGASDDVMEMSKSYGLFILLASVFTMGNMTMNNILRAEGSAKLSMIAMVIGSLLNVALDPLFIFTFDLGISGAAMATALSQMVTFAILISRYLGHHTMIKIHRKYFHPSLSLYGEILKVGIPTFFRQLLFSVSLGVLNQGAMSYGGPNLLAAIGLVFKIGMIISYGLFGIGQGFQPVVGYNYGANSYKRVKDSLSFTLKLSFTSGLVGSLLMVLFDEAILSIFKPSAEVVSYGIIGIKYMAISIILMSITNIIGVFYQALGRGKESLLLSVARQGIFLIPLILLLPIQFGSDGILSAQMYADVLTLILTGILFTRFALSYSKKSKTLEGERVYED